MTTLELPGANPAAPSTSSFMPDMSWTKNIPAAKRLDCISVASEVFTQAERKLSQVERTGLDRERVRVAAFLPRLPETPLDRGARRYASYMGKKFREHGIDFRVEEAHSADALELLLMGAQVNEKIHGTFIFFPTPFGKNEDYFLRRVRPEKDIEGLTVENTGRMALNIRTVDEEEKYEGVVPCTARAILTLLSQHNTLKKMFPRDSSQPGPTAVIFNNSSRIGIPLQSMLMRVGATAVDGPCPNPAGRPRAFPQNRRHRRYRVPGAFGGRLDSQRETGSGCDRLFHRRRSAPRCGRAGGLSLHARQSSGTNNHRAGVVQYCVVRVLAVWTKRIRNRPWPLTNERKSQTKL